MRFALPSGIASALRRPAPPLAAAGLAVAFTALAAATLPRNVALSAERGNWRGPTSGLRRSGAEPLLRAGERSRVRFGLARAEPAWVRLSASRRRPLNPVTLQIERDGERYATLELRAEPVLVRIPFRTGRDRIEIAIEARSGRARVPPSWFLHGVELERTRRPARMVAWCAPALLGAGALLLLGRRLGAALAACWAALAAAALLMALAALWDPPVLWQLSPLVWLALAACFAGCAALLALITEAAGGEPAEPLRDASRGDWLGLSARELLAVFGAALAARLAFLFLVDQPLLYSHQYTYFHNGLAIALHPEPFAYLLHSDDWRLWHHHWTIAPLYYVFLGALLRLGGLQLLAVQLVQCLLDAATAVAVASLGRRVAGRHGLWAGVVYAGYWPAVEIATWTMTENLQTPLLVGSLAVLAAGAPRRRTLLSAGVLAGLASLARSVSIGLLAAAAVWLPVARGLRRGALAAGLVLLGGAAVVLPWAARNAFVIGDPVLIEDNGAFNFWDDNAFSDDPDERERQSYRFQNEPDAATRRSLAMSYAVRGLESHPARFLEKVRSQFWHFLRPEGLHYVTRLEAPLESWRRLGLLLLDDAILLPTVALFPVFLLAGRPSHARGLIALWTLYYLLVVVVIFHNEVRYRSALMPFAIAGAAGGLAVLADRSRRRRPLSWLALGLGCYLAGASVQPYWSRIGASLAVRIAAPAVAAAVDRGDLGEARRRAAAAATRHRSRVPWLDLGRSLHRAGHPDAALEAYQGWPDHLRAAVARPRLLRALGREDEAERALARLDRLSWSSDPWLVLETAWRELPPPTSDEIELGWCDYGAVRGFFQPRGSPAAERLHGYPGGGPQPPPGRHRWTRHRAWLRLIPATTGAAYRITLHMGSPFPSPAASPMVRVEVAGRSERFELGREIRPYSIEVPAPAPGEPLLVRIDAPTWSRLREPASSGVRVDRMTVAPRVY